jgi:hypothetical protein
MFVHVLNFFSEKMVTTRSGQQIVHKVHTTRKHVNIKRRFLESSAVRKGADGLHRCCICLKRMELRSNADWFQCPSCRDVTHTQCLLRYCTNVNTDTPRCPYCRTEKIPITESGGIDILELDNRWQVQDTLVPEEESSDDSDASG